MAKQGGGMVEHTHGASDPRMAFWKREKGGPNMTRLRSRHWLGVATLAVVCAVFVSGTAWAATTGGLRGSVRDASTGEPIGLATVTIPELKRGATTDAQGNYCIINLPAGRYTVRVALLGY